MSVSDSKAKLRWWQFDLQRLFVVTTVLIVLIGLFGPLAFQKYRAWQLTQSQPPRVKVLKKAVESVRDPSLITMIKKINETAFYQQPGSPFAPDYKRIILQEEKEIEETGLDPSKL